jgi:hypothetical protein
VPLICLLVGFFLPDNNIISGSVFRGQVTSLKVSNFTLNSSSTLMDKKHNLGSSETIYASGKDIQLKKTDYYTMGQTFTRKKPATI